MFSKTFINVYTFTLFVKEFAEDTQHHSNGFHNEAGNQKN